MAQESWTEVPVDSEEEWTEVPVDDITPEGPSSTMSGFRQGLQGLTGGFSDELVGAGEAAGRVLGIEGVGGPMSEMGLADDGPTLDWQTLRDAYRSARDRERGNLKKDIESNPGISHTANIAGMIASPINKIAAPLSAAKGGAVLGGVNALGSSDAESVGGMAADTAIGAGLGGAIGKGVEMASPVLQKGVDKMGAGARDIAERLGVRALGGERGSIKKVGFDRAKQAAGQALDEGVITPLASTDDMIARNAAVKTRGGDMMGEAYKAIDDAGASTFNPIQVAKTVDDELGGFYRSPLNRGEASQFDNTIDAIKMRAPENMTYGDYAAPINATQTNIPLSKAQALKAELGRAANWQNKLVVSPKEQLAREAYGIVNKAIDDAVAAGSETIENAGLGEALATGKKLFGNASTADTFLDNRLAREQGNKILGLTDTITGAGAMGANASLPGAGAAILAKKGIEQYGAQTGAVGFNKVAKALMKSPKMADLAQRSPKVFNAIVQKMEGQVSGGIGKAADNERMSKPYDKNALIQKTQGTKYQQVLENAAQRGDQAFGAAHFLLQSKDPEYRKITVGTDD